MRGCKARTEPADERPGLGSSRQHTSTLSATTDIERTVAIHFESLGLTLRAPILHIRVEGRNGFADVPLVERHVAGFRGAHGPVDPAAAVSSMVAHLDAGFTTWDLADHYGPAEDFVGELRRRVGATRGAVAPDGVCAFTKWVPRPGPMTRQVAQAAIGVSLRRMDMAVIDLLQFHRWD